MKYLIKNYTNYKKGDTRIISKFAWLPTIAEDKNGYEYIIWLEKYNEKQIYFEYENESIWMKECLYII